MGRRLQISVSRIGLRSPTEKAGGKPARNLDLDKSLGKEKQKSAKKKKKWAIREENET